MAGQFSSSNQFPFPFNTEGADASAVVEGNSIKFSFTVNRDAVAPVLERWTWNDAIVTIRSGDRDILISFPKISEQTRRS